MEQADERELLQACFAAAGSNQLIKDCGVRVAGRGAVSADRPTLRKMLTLASAVGELSFLTPVKLFSNSKLGQNSG